MIHSAPGAAGFSDITIERRADVSRAPSARQAATAYCQGSPLRNEIEARGPDKLEHATDLAAAAIAKRYGSGAVEGKIQALVVSARA